MSFSDSDEERLIRHVFRHPVIYDVAHPEYRNPVAKDTVWRDLAEKLNKTSDDCKKKWKFLRDGYHRFKKGKSKTGFSTSKSSKSRRHELLSFLDEVPQHASYDSASPMTVSQSALETEDENQDEDEKPILQPEVVITQEESVSHSCTDPLQNGGDKPEFLNEDRNTRKLKRKHMKTEDEDFNVKMRKDRDEREKQLFHLLMRKKEDDIDLFCRHIGEVLRTLPPVCRAEAKKNIGIIVSDYEIMAARSASDANSCSNASSVAQFATCEIQKPNRHNHRKKT